MTEKHQKIYYMILFLLVPIILAIIYIYNIPEIPTLMELPDETGYLWNAAYFLGIDWNDLGKSSFYGYGYSIFLIPLFRICSSGTDLIRGAYIVNILFVLGIYMILVRLLRNFCEQCFIWIPLIAGVSCITPYLVTSSYKVICENCLTFFVTLLILCFYRSIKTRKIYYYILSVLVAAFIPFIHTRGIVITGVFCLFTVIDMLEKRDVHIKRIFIVISVFVGAFLLFYLVKKNNLNFRQMLRVESGYGESTTNLVTSSFIIKRLVRIIDIGLLNYFFSLVSRLFYCVCSTGGLVVLVILNIGNEIKSILDNKDKTEIKYAENISLLMIVFSFLLTLVACVFNSIGDNFQYVYYGRYYEHTLPIILCCGLYMLFNNELNVKLKTYFITILCITLLCIFSCKWVSAYLKDVNIYIDTARTAAFSYSIKLHDQYTDAMCYSCIIAILVILLCIFSYKKRIVKLSVVILLGITFWNIDNICIEKIQEAANRAEGDYQIANYVSKYVDNHNIYTIDDHSYKYENVIHKMQVLIKNYRVYEIPYSNDDIDLLEQIKEGDYVIVYKTNKLNLEEIEYTKIKDGNTFVLYRK